MYINIQLTEELSNRIEEHVKVELPKILGEILLANNNKILKDLILTKITGLINATINETLQEKEFKAIVRDEVMKFFNRGNDNE